MTTSESGLTKKVRKNLRREVARYAQMRVVARSHLRRAISGRQEIPVRRGLRPEGHASSSHWPRMPRSGERVHRQNNEQICSTAPAP